MIKILLASASTTGPLERFHSKLSKMCYKDKNKVLVENLEILYLLGSPCKWKTSIIFGFGVL